MRRDIAIATVVDLCRAGAGFRGDTATLALAIGKPRKSALIESLLECGVIPESFSHDSSEEKLYAKYCDVLLSFAFQRMGMSATIIEERSGAADVEGETEAYSIVGDAKAFRLSRTAKNQKDFKVAALSGWRGKRDFACLVCPIYQYPNTRSQIYSQAIKHNVTLLGYVHLTFLIEHAKAANLAAIWNVAKVINETNSAAAYWKAVDSIVCQAVGKKQPDLDEFKDRERIILEKIKQVEVRYLESEMEAILSLTKEQAVQRLIEEMNIPSRIAQIKRAEY